MKHYDGYDRGCFPCGESYFDKQQFTFYKQPSCFGKEDCKIGCNLNKKFLMECELKCRPYRPKPACPPKPCCLPLLGCICLKKFW